MSSTPWSTASFGDSADTSPGELSALGDHMGACSADRGRLFAFRSGAHAVHGFLAGRLITTLALGAVLLGAVLLWR